LAKVISSFVTFGCGNKEWIWSSKCMESHETFRSTSARCGVGG
jgi:hypothetical protein